MSTHITLINPRQTISSAFLLDHPIELVPGYVHRVKRTHNTIRVLYGHLWVSVNGKDYILGEGETFSLPPNRQYAALLSTADERSAFYAVA